MNPGVFEHSHLFPFSQALRQQYSKLCDKFEQFAKRKLDVIVTGRLYSSQRTGGLCIYADDIGFVNAFGKKNPMTAEMALAQRTNEIEEEMVEIDEAVL